MKTYTELNSRLKQLTDTAANSGVFKSRSLLEMFFSSAELDLAPFWRYIKLIHTDDLKNWSSLQEYSKHKSLSYADYWEGLNIAFGLQRKNKKVLQTLEELEQLDIKEPTEYDTLRIEVPRSFIFRKQKIQLPETTYENTTYNSYKGKIEQGKLIINGKWRKQVAYIKRLCPKHIRYQKEILALKKWMEEQPKETLDEIELLRTHRFIQPVLFISHRWESTENPDPNGNQYKKLCELRDCFMVYDYASFPQDKTNDWQKMALDAILDNMNRLIYNVIVLDSPDFLNRGWCIYEYVLASLKMTTVCDEINDPLLVELRNFVATKAPLTPTDQIWKGNGMQSQLQNGISIHTLEVINQLIPLFRNSLFTVASDRIKVKNLFIQQLIKVLPQKKEYLQYLGEWKAIEWTEEALQDAFESEIKLDGLQQGPKIKPYSLKVPSTICEAQENGFQLDSAPMQSEFSWLSLIKK